MRAQLCLTLCDPMDCDPPGDLMDCSLQAPLSMDFPGKNTRVGLPFPSPRDLPDPGIKHQSTGVSTLASFLSKKSQGRPPGTGWISLQSKRLSRVFSNTTVQKHQVFSTQLFFIVQLSHPYMTTGKTIALTRWTFVGKVISTF